MKSHHNEDDAELNEFVSWAELMSGGDRCVITVELNEDHDDDDLPIAFLVKGRERSIGFTIHQLGDTVIATGQGFDNYTGVRVSDMYIES